MIYTEIANKAEVERIRVATGENFYVATAFPYWLCFAWEPRGCAYTFNAPASVLSNENFIITVLGGTPPNEVFKWNGDDVALVVDKTKTPYILDFFGDRLELDREKLIRFLEPIATVSEQFGTFMFCKEVTTSQVKIFGHPMSGEDVCLLREALC